MDAGGYALFLQASGQFVSVASEKLGFHDNTILVPGMMGIGGDLLELNSRQVSQPLIEQAAFLRLITSIGPNV